MTRAAHGRGRKDRPTNSEASSFVYSLRCIADYMRSFPEPAGVTIKVLLCSETSQDIYLVKDFLARVCENTPKQPTRAQVEAAHTVRREKEATA